MKSKIKTIAKTRTEIILEELVNHLNKQIITIESLIPELESENSKSWNEGCIQGLLYAIEYIQIYILKEKEPPW